MFCFNARRKKTNCIKWDHNEGTVPFGIADSDYPTCAKITNALAKRARTGAYGYGFYSDEYTQTVIDWIKRRYGYKVSADNISHANGVVFAINYLLKTLTGPNDSIIIQTPVYNMFKAVLDKNKRRVIENPLIKDGNTFRIDFDDLEAKMQSGAKMLIFCSPHNPTGNVWSRSDVKQVVELCKKHGVILISDEIHCDLILFDNEFVSSGTFFDEYKDIIICTAPSKTFNLAGFFTSNIVFGNIEHKRLFDRMLDDNCCTAPNLFGAVACETAYKYGEKWLKRQNDYLGKNFLYLKKFVEKNIPQANVCDLQGTYLAFVDFTYLGLNDEQLEQLFLSYGVSANFGGHYGKKYQGYVRLNLACPRRQLKAGLERLVVAVNSRV